MNESSKSNIMVKQFTTGFALMVSAAVFSQVGIDTETPQATLDVVGKASDASSLDGIIAPRLTGEELRAKTYTADQTGALVYVTAADTAPAGQTENVTAAGYYYFDGTMWVKAGAGDMVNIYNSDGTLTDDRNVYTDGKLLQFVGSDQMTQWGGMGYFYQMGLDSSSNGNASMALIAADKDGSGNSTRMDIQAFPDAGAQIVAIYDATALDIGTSYTTDSAPVTFSTSAGGGASSTEKMRITGEGNVGINTNEPTEKLDVDGIARLRDLPLNGMTDAIHTTPDGDQSSTQDQTFTATKTVVADENGVLGYVEGLPSDANIYNVNGTLTENRVVATNNNTLTFSGNGNNVRITNNGTESRFTATGTGRGSLAVTGGNSGVDVYADNNSVGQIAARGTGNTGLDIRTERAVPLRLLTNNSERMRITGEGNIGLNTISPTERFDNNGITRLRNLPLDGATNAIFTLPGGGASSTQNQTFTATRTVVADANGVLGYVNGIPADPGTPRVVISVGVPGTQNIMNSSPSTVTAQFTNEFIDTHNAWSSNTFTVPTGMGGLYIIAMQNSSEHTVGGNEDWHTIAFYEKSTDGGTTWQVMIKDINSSQASTNVDNGNSLYWTGNLNAGDRIRVRFNCNSTTNNIVKLGSLTITKLTQ